MAPYTTALRDGLFAAEDGVADADAEADTVTNIKTSIDIPGRFEFPPCVQIKSTFFRIHKTQP